MKPCVFTVEVGDGIRFVNNYKNPFDLPWNRKFLFFFLKIRRVRHTIRETATADLMLAMTSGLLLVTKLAGRQVLTLLAAHQVVT